MRIDSIRNGIVIDHIPAGLAMQLYHMLDLDQLDCPVAIIKNATSSKLGKKDIIKVDSRIDLDMDMVGFVAPNASVCIIRDGEVCEKKHLALPRQLTDIICCKNPRCITTTEQDIHQIFYLSNPEKREYRCRYCDAKAERLPV